MVGRWVEFPTIELLNAAIFRIIVWNVLCTYTFICVSTYDLVIGFFFFEGSSPSQAVASCQGKKGKVASGLQKFTRKIFHISMVQWNMRS